MHRWCFRSALRIALHDSRARDLRISCSFAGTSVRLSPATKTGIKREHTPGWKHPANGQKKGARRRAGGTIDANVTSQGVADKPEIIQADQLDSGPAGATAEASLRLIQGPTGTMSRQSG